MDNNDDTVTTYEMNSHAAATTVMCSKEAGTVATMLVEPALGQDEAAFLNPNCACTLKSLFSEDP